MRNTLLVLSLLVCFAFSIRAAHAIDVIPECIEASEHTAVTYFLVDRSDVLKDTQNLQQTLLVLKKMIASGERLIVGVSAGTAGETRVIMDFARPQESLWVSKLKLRASEKKFDSCFAAMKEKVVSQGEKHPTSAILETLGVVSKVLSGEAAEKKRVVLFSDMLQNSAQISFLKAQKLETAALMKMIEKDKLVSLLPQVEVHIAGAGTGASDEKSRAVEDFWKSYFERAGAKLKFYGPVLFAS